MNEINHNGCMDLIASAYAALTVRLMKEYKGKMTFGDYRMWQRKADIAWHDVYAPLYVQAKEIEL